MLRRVALVRTDVSEECSASNISVTRISDLGKTLAVKTSNLTLIKRVSELVPSLQKLLLCVITQNIPRDSRIFPFIYSNKTTPWRLVCERSIPAERPPLVDEI
jgi:hypothetical protein